MPLSAGQGDYNAIAAIVRTMIGKTGTVMLVRVEAVTNDGDEAAAGTVDILPLVAQLDGSGNATPHGTIFDVPYVRIQGGANAVIMDPQVGDIGLAMVCSRDISAVKANKSPSTPGSLRRYNLADSLYLGGVLNGVPTQFIRFHEGGINLKPAAGQKVTVEGPLHVTGAVTGAQTAVFQGNVTGAGKSLATHTHGGVQSGGSQTAPPT